jgi:hypothetical protein
LNSVLIPIVGIEHGHGIHLRRIGACAYRSGIPRRGCYRHELSDGCREDGVVQPYRHGTPHKEVHVGEDHFPRVPVVNVS